MGGKDWSVLRWWYTLIFRAIRVLLSKLIVIKLLELIKAILTVLLTLFSPDGIQHRERLIDKNNVHSSKYHGSLCKLYNCMYANVEFHDMGAPALVQSRNHKYSLFWSPHYISRCTFRINGSTNPRMLSWIQDFWTLQAINSTGIFVFYLWCCKNAICEITRH